MLKKRDRMRTFCVMLKPETIALIKENSMGNGPYRWFIEEAIECLLSSGYKKKSKKKSKKKTENSVQPNTKAEREIRL